MSGSLACVPQVRNLKQLFDVTDVVDDVHGVVDETMQRTAGNISHVCNHHHPLPFPHTPSASSAPAALVFDVHTFTNPVAADSTICKTIWKAL